MYDRTIRPHLSSKGTQLMIPSAAAIIHPKFTRVSPNAPDGALCKKQLRVLEGILKAHNMVIVPIEEAQNLQDGDDYSRMERELCEDDIVDTGIFCKKNFAQIRDTLAQKGVCIVPASHLEEKIELVTRKKPKFSSSFNVI